MFLLWFEISRKILKTEQKMKIANQTQHICIGETYNTVLTAKKSNKRMIILLFYSLPHLSISSTWDAMFFSFKTDRQNGWGRICLSQRQDVHHQSFWRVTSTNLHLKFRFPSLARCDWRSFLSSWIKMMSSLVSHGSDAESGTHRPSSNSHTPVSVSSGTYRSFSPSRRLFCLLAAFDFLATLFIWILYAHVSKLLSFSFKMFVVQQTGVHYEIFIPPYYHN